MSVLGYTEALNSDLQIWNNAAFDNGCDSEDSSLMINPISNNPSGSSDSYSNKENQTPRFAKSSLTEHSPAVVSFRPLNPNSDGIGNVNSKRKPMIKKIPKQGLVEKKINEEIKEIESEISRLSSKLEALRLEKAERNAKNVENSGRVVAAKFTEQKQSVKNSEGVRNVGERLKLRRGFSMGPNEIMGVGKSRQTSKQEITPLQPVNSRRKSCFWKLQDIEEENSSKGGGGRRVISSSRFSLSPISRKSIGKALGTRHAVTTIASKKGLNLKKEDEVLPVIQPKKLFVKDGENSVPAKKPLKSGRVIASRYNNQSTTNSVMRKRSLPENDKDESRKLCGNESGRVKKRWDKPSEILIPKLSEFDEWAPPDTSVVRNVVLPKIKVVRCTNETPRDSGPAKRVAELIRKNSFFGDDDDEVVEASVCQALSFGEDYEEEE